MRFHSRNDAGENTGYLCEQIGMLKKIYDQLTLAITHAWYQGSVGLYLLWPLGKLFSFITTWRYQRVRKNLKPSQQRAPVVVVGNLTVGGAGKTPCVIALAKFFQQHGYTPGIVSRGYGGRAPYYPYCVDMNSTVNEVGDEAFLLYQTLNCPVVIDPHRKKAVEHLLALKPQVNLVLTDDGLQHYALARDYEIVVWDSKRGVGNGWCLPAGPLRESLTRLDSVDLILQQGDDPLQPSFTLKPQAFVQITLPYKQLPLDFHFYHKPVHAVAGIGNPTRFFDSLQALGLTIIPHVFPDHHWFTAQDLDYNNDYPLIMTAKDAVKCTQFAKSNWYYLHVQPELNAKACSELQQLFKV